MSIQAPAAQPPFLTFIVGPTAVGKTALAVRAAEALGGEVVSCDSQQVYQGMDIGTGKIDAATRARVPHHLLDVIAPDGEMTAARYVELADAAIADIAARGKPIIVCGGTGLYVRTLLFGLFEGPKADLAIRKQLYDRIAQEGAAAVHAELMRVDPTLGQLIDSNDHKRMVRALEVYIASGVPMSVHQANHNHRTLPPRYPHRLVGLTAEREQLYARINLRVAEMFEQGLVEEVERLRAAGYCPPLRSQQAIGYAEVHAMLEGATDLAQTIELVQRNSRRYARRQLTWYRADSSVTWWSDGSQVDVSAFGRYGMGEHV